MPTYKAPLRDISFCLREMLSFDNIRQLPGNAEVSDDLIDTILQEGARFCENELFPLNHTGDAEGCKYNDGVVTTPQGFKKAYQEFMSGGWGSLSCDPNFGGQGLPDCLAIMMEEMTCSANLSFGLYPGLTKGAYIALHTHGSDDLKNKFLPKLVAGDWSGTMNLTEPHCGTDLGMLKTKAIVQNDGSYKLTGTKIFISSGEHDLTENIIHLVLARTPDAPEGVKGISLFLVPKFMVDDQGQIGERNAVYCAAIEHKMGIKASATCVMNYDGATGYLIGSLNKGLNYMFTMMNVERLGVGMQGLGIGEVAYQNALTYARERLQGRSLKGAQYPDKPADPLMVHPDIRRMLLTMKAYNEGNRMLAAWTAHYVDIAHRADNEKQRQDADDFVHLMTPIIKSFLTDSGFEVANLAIQVHGGFGYTRDYGVEQYARDARICQIYEGTNGIQALDLVGRKMPMHMGRLLRSFFHPVQNFIEQNQEDQKLREFIDPLSKSFDRLQKACLTVGAKALSNPEEAGAAATDFLNLFAHTALAYLWAKAAMIAIEKLNHTQNDNFYISKIETARFYFAKLLPKTSSLFATIMTGSKPLMTMTDNQFGHFEFAI